MDKAAIEKAVLGMIGYHIENPEATDLNETLWETLGHEPSEEESDFAYGVIQRMRLVVDPEGN